VTLADVTLNDVTYLSAGLQELWIRKNEVVKIQPSVNAKYIRTNRIEETP
jgi:hypothetical protein